MSRRPKVDLDRISEQCQALKLMHTAECVAELVEEASRDELTPVHFLGLVLERELSVYSTRCAGKERLWVTP